jgi:small subunit ribosomal protein S21
MTSEFRRSQVMGNKVFVKDDNIEKALRKFKKKVADSGILQTLKEKEFFQKPTTTRKRAKSAAVNRWNKKLADQQLPKKLF